LAGAVRRISEKWDSGFAGAGTEIRCIPNADDDNDDDDDDAGSLRCALQVSFYLIHISNMLEVLNSSVNFLIYFACHRYFRPVKSGSSCSQLFVPALRAPVSLDLQDTRSPARATTQPDVFCLQELPDDAETARDGDGDDGQQQQPQPNTSAWLSDADLSRRTNNPNADQNTALKTSQSSPIPSRIPGEEMQK